MSEVTSDRCGRGASVRAPGAVLLSPVPSARRSEAVPTLHRHFPLLPQTRRQAPAHVCDEVTGCRELYQAVLLLLPPCSLVAGLLAFAFLLVQNGVVGSFLGDVFVDVHAHIVHAHFHVDVVTRLLLAPRVGGDCPQ